MKSIFFSLFLIASSVPSIACDDMNTLNGIAEAAGYDGVNCGIAENLSDLIETLNNADSYDEEYVRTITEGFMHNLLAADLTGTDGDFSAQSIVNDFAVYVLFDYADDPLQVAVKGETKATPRSPLTKSLFKPVGFTEFKTIAGFKTNIMVIEPYTAPFPQ